MSIQTLIMVSAVGWAAYYFARGAYLDLKAGNACSHCSAGGGSRGCPAAKRR